MMNELYVSIQQAQKDPSQMEALIEKWLYNKSWGEQIEPTKKNRKK